MAVKREQIYSAFLPQQSVVQRGQAKNLEDAIGFLKAAHLIEEDVVFSSRIQEAGIPLPFAALLLRQFRKLENAPHQVPILDLLYVQILARLFISPSRMWIDDLHAAVNQLDLAQQVGGVSQEKVGAWKRVMEFLGVGYRVANGFYCLYRPELVESVARQWADREGPLQAFLERHMQNWLPCLSDSGEISLSALYPLGWLAETGSLSLFSKQDSPFRPYGGDRRLRGIKLL
jgi:hypothetical protein